MDVINKLYSTVSTTVSQLSGVLPGNPVTREYEIISFTGTVGPSQLWKVYKGCKKSTKEMGSIFVFEKRSLERCPKSEQECILALLRRGIFQLTRLRHPQILTVQHSMEESRESLAFVTEPVLTSVANLIQKMNTLSPDQSASQTEEALFEVEIKHGLMQVGEGLAFLHNKVKMLHGNINPETILVNEQGVWKIFGFDFCVLSQNNPDTEPYWACVDYSCKEHLCTIPNLNYLAPEYALSCSCSPASDMYSVGQLIVAVYNKGEPLFVNSHNNWREFEKACSQAKRVPDSKLVSIPEGLRLYVNLMVNLTPELRPDAHQFVKIGFFEDIGVKTLMYLDALFQWDNLQKSQFYKGLPQIIPTLPRRVLLKRILPCLIKEFVNRSMIPFVLPNVLLITEQCSKEEYMIHVFPELRNVMKIQDPIQVLLIFMQKMELLLRLTPAEEIKTDVLPMVYHALESNVQQIQELCLSVLPTFAGLVDYPAMKNSVLPRIKRLCLVTQHVSVRVNCLVCIGKLLEHLDKWLVLDEVLPFLPSIPSREPAVLMGILGIYKIAMMHKKLGITKELMANKILPFLIPLSVDGELSLNQFNAFMLVIKEMVSRVETEHRGKLEQLTTLQQTQSPPLALQEQSLRAPPPQPTELDRMFTGLGIDTSSLSSSTLPTVSSKSKESFSNGSAVSLTLEEKQSLAHQQEAQRRLQAQPALTPTMARVASATASELLKKDVGLLRKNLYEPGSSTAVSDSSGSSSSVMTVRSQPFKKDACGLLDKNVCEVGSSSILPSSSATSSTNLMAEFPQPDYCGVLRKTLPDSSSSSTSLSTLGSVPLQKNVSRFSEGSGYEAGSSTPPTASTTSTTSVTTGPSQPFAKDYCSMLERNLSQINSSMRTTSKSSQASSSPAAGQAELFTPFQAVNVNVHNLQHKQSQWMGFASPFAQPGQSQPPQWSTSTIGSGTASQQQFYTPVQTPSQSTGTYHTANTSSSVSAQSAGIYISANTSISTSASTSSTSTSDRSRATVRKLSISEIDDLLL